MLFLLALFFHISTFSMIIFRHYTGSKYPVVLFLLGLFSRREAAPRARHEQHDFRCTRSLHTPNCEVSTLNSWYCSLSSSLKFRVPPGPQQSCVRSTAPELLARVTPPWALKTQLFFHYFFDAFFNRFVLALGSNFHPNSPPKTHQTPPKIDAMKHSILGLNFS